MDKTLILLEDLLCAIEYIKRDSVSISFHHDSNEDVWTIRGFKKNLVIMLHYQIEPKITDEQLQIKDCSVLLERLDISRLKNCYISSAQELEQCSKYEDNENNGTNTQSSSFRDKFAMVTSLEAHATNNFHVSDKNLDGVIHLQMDELYHCLVCDTIFRDSDTVKVHMQEKHPKYSQCAKPEIDQQKLKINMQKLDSCMLDVNHIEDCSQSDNLFHCLLCETIFCDLHSFKVHMLKRHSQYDEEKIDQQNIETNTEKLNSCILDANHIVKDHSQPDNIFHCLLCETIFCDADSLKVHMREKHSQCVNLDVDTNAMLNLSLPDVSHSVEYSQVDDVFHCFICETIFSDLRSITVHMQEKHSQHSLYDDEEMDQQDIETNTQKLDSCILDANHIVKDHSQPDNIFYCLLCETIFCDRDSLKVHMREKHSQCGNLDVGTNAMLNVSLPDVSHSVEYSQVDDVFHCFICETLFSDLRSITVHMKEKHSQHSRYDDEEMDQQNIETNTRKLDSCILDANHIVKDHSQPDNIFHCSLCEAIFCDRNSLKVHMREKHSQCGNLDVGTNAMLNVTLPDVSHSEEYSQVDDVFHCFICETIFSDLRSIKVHMQERHSQHSRYDEKIDQQSIETNTQKLDSCILDAIHIVKDHSQPDNIFHCLLCETIFCDKDSLKTHTREKHSQCENLNVCTNVRLDFSLPDVSHIEENNSQVDDAFNCFICGTIFCDLASFSAHMDKKHYQYRESNKDNLVNKNCFQCSLCGDNFISRTSFDQHMEVLHDQKQYECSECGKKFSQKGALKMHKLVHTGEKPYKCSQCDKKYTSKSTLNRHQVCHIGGGRHECIECGKKFCNRSSLKLHKVVHTREKPYECTQCEEKFSQKNALTLHSHVHTKELPFECLQCGMNFSRKCSLDQHMLVHAGEKPCECSECGMKFIDLSEFNQHKVKHNGGKPYQCLQCDKTFSHRRTLLQHNRVHSGEPYECLQCEKRFTNKSALDTHQLVHTIEKSYECLQCRKSFHSESYLQEHKQFHCRDVSTNVHDVTPKKSKTFCVDDSILGI